MKISESWNQFNLCLILLRDAVIADAGTQTFPKESMSRYLAMQGTVWYIVAIKGVKLYESTI